MKKLDITAAVKQALTDLGVVTKRPAFCTVGDWCLLSGMRERSVYEALARGDLRAVKNGTRTLIDAEAGLKWLQSLPAAKIRPMRRLTEPSAPVV